MYRRSCKQQQYTAQLDGDYHGGNTNHFEDVIIYCSTEENSERVVGYDDEPSMVQYLSERRELELKGSANVHVTLVANVQ